MALNCLTHLVAFVLSACVVAATDGNEIQVLIDSAISSGSSFLRIPAGEYPTWGPSGVLVSIAGARNLVIDATGAYMTCLNQTRAISFSNSTNVTIIGLQVDYDPPPFTQGTVIHVANDSSYVDIALDTGYPQQLYTRAWFYNATTLDELDRVNYPWGAVASWAVPPGGVTQPGTLRVTLPGIGVNVTVGSRSSISGDFDAGSVPHTIVVDDGVTRNGVYPPLSGSISLINVSVYASNCMGVLEGSGRGGLLLDGVVIAPGPRPPAGATAPRILATNADAVQCNNIARGPTVRRLYIRNAGDDSFSIQSQDMVVLAVSPNGSTLVLGGRTPYGAPYVGDALTVNLTSAPLAVEALQWVPWTGASAAGVAPWVIDTINASCGYCFWHVDKGALWQVRLNASALEAWDAVPGTSVHNVGRQGNGYLVEDSVIDGNGRCALLKAGDGVFRRNTCRGAGLGVVLRPELSSNASAVIRNVTIGPGNAFVRTNYPHAALYSAEAGAVCAAAEGDGGLLRQGIIADLAVVGNSFSDVLGVNVVLGSVDNAEISGNTFSQTFAERPAPAGEAFGVNQSVVAWVSAVSGVAFQNNSAGTLGPFGLGCVALGPMADGVTGLPRGLLCSQSSIGRL